MTPVPIADFARVAVGMVPGVPRAIPAAVGRVVGQIAVSDIRRNITQGRTPGGAAFVPLSRPRPRGGDKPLQDTGQLKASISAEPTDFGARVGTTHPGAAVQNFGGTVRPVNAGALAIPVTVEAVRAGSPRRFPRKLFVLKKSQHPDGGALAEEVGKGPNRRVVVHYLLRKSVRVPAREFWGLSDSAVKAIGDAAAEMMGAEFLKG